MIFRGFMTLSVKASGVVLIFKTLNLGELRRVNEIRQALPAHQNVIPHLAYSLYCLDGVNVLPHREEDMSTLIDFFEHFRPSQQKQFLSMLNVLNDRAIKEMNKLVPYAYGHRSKLQWSSFKNMILCDPSVTQVAGTRELGLNECQKTWIYLNRMEDQHTIFDLNYDLAKFIVSPHTKEIKKINDQETQKSADEKARRERIHLLGYEDGWSSGQGSHLVDNSVEELMSQIERTLRGEKDFHDLVVEEHENRVRARIAAEKEQRRLMIEDGQRRYDEMLAEQDAKPVALRPFTPAEVEAEMKRLRQQRHETLKNKPDHGEALDEERQGDFQKKWGMDRESSFEADYMQDMADYKP